MQTATNSSAATAATAATANLPRPPPCPTPRKSLVMWSGGLDSTYALVRLLTETRDEIHVHHVHCNVRADDGLHRSRRCEYEAEAIATMTPLLRAQCRPFRYSESRVDLTAFDQFASDVTTMMYFAAQAALTAGLTPFDRIVLGVNADDDWEWRPESAACSLRRLLAAWMLKTVWESDDVPFIYLWNPRPTKREEAAYLSGDVVARTASCREPVPAGAPGTGAVGFARCGTCPQCRVLAGMEGGRP